MARTTGSMSGLLLRLLLVFPCFNVSFFQVTGQEASNSSYHADQFIYPNNAARSYRNNFCDLLNGNRSNFELDKSLSGVEIRVGLLEAAFAKFDYTYDENGIVLNQTLSAKYPGLVPRLLDELCGRSGCTWRTSYYALSNDLPDGKTYADYLVWITDVYDLAADWWMQSIERLRTGTTFTDVWYDASIIMVGKDEAKQKEPEDRLELWGWLEPFSTTVWFVIVATIFGSAAVYFALERIDPNSDISEEQLTYMETVWMFGTAVTGQFEFAPKTNAARLFTFSISFWALLVISAYTANLAAFLVKRNQSVTIQLDTIEQAINNGKKMCVWKGSNTDISISKEYPAFADGKNYIRASQEGSYKKVLSGECDIVITEQATWDQFQVVRGINGNCTLRQIGGTWQRKDASFGIKGDSGQYCTSYLRDVFDYHFFAIKQEGLLEDLWAEEILSASTVNCAAGLGTAVRHLGDNQNSELQMKKHRVLKAAAAKNAGSEGGAVASNENVDSNNDELNMINMGGVFILHGMLTAATLILAFLPWVYRKVSHRNHPEFYYEDPHNGVIQDNKPPTHFKPKKARKLNLGSDGDEKSASGEAEVEVFSDTDEVMCENGDPSTFSPLPGNVATTEQVEELKEELKVCISRVEAKLDMLCSQNE